MLHKRFKVAKCKTSLKLASSRIKLLKNKKGVQINQIKKELAQLLESGQDRTARIRVEHVIREEKMVAAYELIEIYCELIVARLPIIESQKTCPIDLKEAITSVVFAAPRCSDITELQDIQKHFTAKYGKDFISGAIELKPDCGVSRMLVEKLSATAPDLKTKMKVLSAVAKEHNINWDPTSFEEKESKPPDDLLNGPTNFQEASADLPKIPTSNAQNVHSHEENPKAPIDFSQQNKRYTLPTHTGGIQAPSASTTHDDTRPSGMGPERMNMRQSFPGNDNDSLSGRENWNMEFTDATSAAQAAAESAERASMAARAAAQLSRQGQRYSKDSFNSSFNDQNPKMQNQQMGPSEQDNKISNRPASSRSRNDSYDENPVNNFHQADGYVKRSSNVGQSPSSPKTSSKNESKSGFTSSKNESSKTENDDYFMEEVIKKQPSVRSSRSHSSTMGDEIDLSNSTQQKTGKRTVVGNPFAVLDQGNIFRETEKTSSYVDTRRDDEADSDDDGPRFDTGFEYDEGEAKSFFPSPGRESVNPLEKMDIWSPRRKTSDPLDQANDPGMGSVNPLENTHIWSPRRKTGDPMDQANNPGMGPVNPIENTHIWSPRRKTGDPLDKVSDPSLLFSERRSLSNHSAKSVDPSVNFDLSDGPDSESESDLAKSSFSGSKFTSMDPEWVPVEVNSRKSRIELNDLVESDEEKPLPPRQSSRVSLRNESKNDIKPPYLEDNTDFLNRSDDSDAGKELKFGSLTGGLRNKGGLKYPPYTKTAATGDSPQEIPPRVDPTPQRHSFNSKTSRFDAKEPSVLIASSESDSDDQNEKFPKLPVQPLKIKSSPFAPPDAFFNSDGTDSEEEAPPVPKRAPTNRINSGSGVSRRTKGSTSAPSSKNRIEPEGKTVNSSSNEPTRLSRHSYNSETPPEPRTEISKQPLNPPKKMAESGKIETSKTSNLSSETSSGADNVKKPSHVHPKLPDYDSLAARIQSLRTNRQ